MGKNEDVSIRISANAYDLLAEIKSILVRRGRRGHDASYKRIIEEALELYKERLEKEG